MRQVHCAGEKAFVDFSGKRPAIIDGATGEVVPVELFVGVLGASSYVYAEACAAQGLLCRRLQAPAGLARVWQQAPAGSGQGRARVGEWVCRAPASGTAFMSLTLLSRTTTRRGHWARSELERPASSRGCPYARDADRRAKRYAITRSTIDAAVLGVQVTCLAGNEPEGGVGARGELTDGNGNLVRDALSRMRNTATVGLRRMRQQGRMMKGTTSRE
jgi:hypothetical protein